MLHRFGFLAGLFAIAVLTHHARAATPRAGSVIFILDCSKTMGEPAQPRSLVKEAVDGDSLTRLDLAKRTLSEMLDQLSAAGTYRVGIHFYGHRLKWEGVETPELTEQDEYLQQSLGFKALSSLLPGDDTERVLALRPFREAELASLAPRVQALKAWGEKPFYSTLVAALDDLSNDSSTPSKSIVILTDGGNYQSMARLKGSKQQVFDAMQRSLVPIHVLHFGSAEGEADETQLANATELRSFVDFAGGDFRYVDDKTTLGVQHVFSTMPKQAPPQTIAATGNGEEPAKLQAVSEVKAKEQNVNGNVVFNGRPVAMATVTIEGTDIPSTKVDADGRFRFRGVPVGKYTVKVEAVVQNKIREKSKALVVDADKEPTLTIDVK